MVDDQVKEYLQASVVATFDYSFDIFHLSVRRVRLLYIMQSIRVNVRGNRISVLLASSRTVVGDVIALVGIGGLIER